MFKAGKNCLAGDRDDDQFDEVSKDKGSNDQSKCFLEIGMRDQHKADSSWHKEESTTEEIGQKDSDKAGFSTREQRRDPCSEWEEEEETSSRTKEMRSATSTAGKYWKT